MSFCHFIYFFGRWFIKWQKNFNLEKAKRFMNKGLGESYDAYKTVHPRACRSVPWNFKRAYKADDRAQVKGFRAALPGNYRFIEEADVYRKQCNPLHIIGDGHMGGLRPQPGDQEMPVLREWCILWKMVWCHPDEREKGG